MMDRVLTLNQLCEVLIEAFRTTTAILARDPSPDADSSAGSLAYRIPGEMDALHTAPFSTFYRRYRYQLNELAFSVFGRVARRRVDNKMSTVLILRAPRWWQKLGGPFDCRRIDIKVSDEGMTVRFAPADLAPLPRKGERWVLLLTPEQAAALSTPSGSHSPDVEKGSPAPVGSGDSSGGRIARWWRAIRW